MRRAALLLVSLAVVAASCGSSDPQVISIVSSAARNEGAADSTAEAPSLSAPDIEFVLADGLKRPTATTHAWRVTAAKDSTSRVKGLADALAITGDPVVGVDGSVTIGDERRVSSWSWAGVVSWSYDARATRGDSAVSPACDPSAGPCDTPTESPPDRMELPRNLISASDALVKARRILGAAGYRADQTALDSGSSEWSTWVDVELLVGGLRSGLVGRIEFGEDGAVTSAYGQFVSTARADEYPLVDLETAVRRLSGQALAGNATVRDAIVPPADSGSPGQVVQVGITSVSLVLQSVTESDTSTLLVPSYRFSSRDGVVGVVFALEDRHMDISDLTDSSPGGTPEPAPGDLAPIPQSEADALVGLSEREATKVATGRGWTVRIAERDGEQFMLTMDFVASRVNLSITGSVVTAVSVG